MIPVTLIGWHCDTIFGSLQMFSLWECNGGDGNFQANEGKVGGGGLWPDTYQRSTVHPWRSREELRSYDASDLRPHCIRKPQTLKVTPGARELATLKVKIEKPMSKHSNGTQMKNIKTTAKAHSNSFSGHFTDSSYFSQVYIWIPFRKKHKPCF